MTYSNDDYHFEISEQTSAVDYEGIIVIIYFSITCRKPRIRMDYKSRQRYTCDEYTYNDADLTYKGDVRFVDDYVMLINGPTESIKTELITRKSYTDLMKKVRETLLLLSKPIAQERFERMR